MTGTDLKHRLAAILAADAAGYSRLMAADERGTVTALDSARAVFRQHIESNQGRVIDMAGDSVLAIFDLATGAVSAALAIQGELNAGAQALPQERRMLYRIGVHTGEIIEKNDGTVYGDGVNVAARLEGLAEAGTVCISEAVRSYVRGKVAGEFEDLGAQTVKNIAEPVRAYRVRAETIETASAVSRSETSVTEIDLSLPDKPSIAVLPFTNMSEDLEQEYFTDGVSEDIITELSRFHSLFVIARNSSFSYKGKSTDIRQVGKELGVRYVLEGSIRKSSNRIRVTAQLIDALTGSHIWAEKYDRVLEDIFAVQEEITASIVREIAPRIRETELARALRKRPENLTAYEIAVRARADLTQAFVRQDQALREEGLRQARAALAIDRDCVLALVQLAFGLWQEIFVGTATDRRENWREALEAANRSIELDPAGYEGYHLRGMLLAISSRSSIEQALEDCRHAHDLNPNDPMIVHAMAFCEQARGNFASAVELHLQALRMNPRDPWAFNVKASLAITYSLAGDYAKGLEWGLSAVTMAPNEGIAYHDLALCYVGLGEFEKARAAMGHARKLAPQFVEAALRGDSVFRRQADRDKYHVFVRIAAGFEDPNAAETLR